MWTTCLRYCGSNIDIFIFYNLSDFCSFSYIPLCVVFSIFLMNTLFPKEIYIHFTFLPMLESGLEKAAEQFTSEG